MTCRSAQTASGAVAPPLELLESESRTDPIRTDTLSGWRPAFLCGTVHTTMQPESPSPRRWTKGARLVRSNERKLTARVGGKHAEARRVAGAAVFDCAQQWPGRLSRLATPPAVRCGRPTQRKLSCRLRLPKQPALLLGGLPLRYDPWGNLQPQLRCVREDKEAALLARPEGSECDSWRRVLEVSAKLRCKLVPPGVLTLSVDRFQLVVTVSSGMNISL